MSCAPHAGLFAWLPVIVEKATVSLPMCGIHPWTLRKVIRLKTEVEDSGPESTNPDPSFVSNDQLSTWSGLVLSGHELFTLSVMDFTLVSNFPNAASNEGLRPHREAATTMAEDMEGRQPPPHYNIHTKQEQEGDSLPEKRFGNGRHHLIPMAKTEGHCDNGARAAPRTISSY